MTKDYMTEMWNTCERYQPWANAQGHGESWALMCKERTTRAAGAAWAAAEAAAWAAAWDATWAAGASEAAAARADDATAAAGFCAAAEYYATLATVRLNKLMGTPHDTH